MAAGKCVRAIHAAHVYVVDDRRRNLGVQINFPKVRQHVYHSASQSPHLQTHWVPEIVRRQRHQVFRVDKVFEVLTTAVKS